MTDEVEIDLNDRRRHMRKLYTEAEYRQKFRRIDFYRPNRKQLEFHNTIARERMLRAGNQLGKTHASSAELAMHSCQIYPVWPDLGGYHGRKFLTKPPIERPFDFLGWVAAPTGQKVRDGMQAKLLGNFRGGDGLGTGLIPLDNLSAGRITMTRGIADEVDSVTFPREDGGTAVIRFKTHAQGRQAYEGEAVDVFALDEDIKGDENEAIYGEGLARLTTTGGIIMVTMTPLLGLTPIRRRFKERAATDSNIREILMTIDDCLESVGGHISDARLEELKGLYKSHQTQTRLYGADMQGEGAVFDISVERIKQQFNWQEFPPYFRWLWALDFRHSGNLSSGHPFAAVLLAHDPESDTIYVVHCFKMLGLPETHAAKIKAHRWGRAPAIGPHDVGRGASISSGETIGQVYRKHGVHMLHEHATFPDGTFGFENGLSEMEGRLAGGRLIVAAHLSQWFDEYQGYHRINGVVNKIDDDILSATRIGVMAIRHARIPEVFEQWRDARSTIPGSNFARGTAARDEYDIFSGRGNDAGRPIPRGRDFDIFSGR